MATKDKYCPRCYCDPNAMNYRCERCHCPYKDVRGSGRGLLLYVGIVSVLLVYGLARLLWG